LLRQAHERGANRRVTARIERDRACRGFAGACELGESGSGVGGERLKVAGFGQRSQMGASGSIALRFGSRAGLSVYWNSTRRPGTDSQITVPRSSAVILILLPECARSMSFAARETASPSGRTRLNISSLASPTGRSRTI